MNLITLHWRRHQTECRLLSFELSTKSFFERGWHFANEVWRICPNMYNVYPKMIYIYLRRTLDKNRTKIQVEDVSEEKRSGSSTFLFRFSISGMKEEGLEHLCVRKCSKSRRRGKIGRFGDKLTSWRERWGGGSKHQFQSNPSIDKILSSCVIKRFHSKNGGK